MNYELFYFENLIAFARLVNTRHGVVALPGTVSLGEERCWASLPPIDGRTTNVSSISRDSKLRRQHMKKTQMHISWSK